MEVRNPPNTILQTGLQARYWIRSLRHIKRSLMDDNHGKIDCCCSGAVKPRLLQLTVFCMAFHHSIWTSFSVYRISLPDSHSMIGTHLFNIIYLLNSIDFPFTQHKVQNFLTDFQALSKNISANLRSLLTPYAPPCSLRSSDKCLLTRQSFAHQSANMPLMCTHLLFGTQYHWTFGFLRHLHCLSET